MVLAIPPASSPDTHIGSSSSSSLASLDIWELDAPKKLNFNTLTWDSKPARIGKMGTLEAGYDRVGKLGPFECRSGTYRTYEVACKEGEEGVGCDVDVTHNSWTNAGGEFDCLSRDETVAY